MVDLHQKKVGIVACSGEELPEGTVTRLAALKVLEELRPEDTVTICLPLFLAGGVGDRAFARFYPTIAVDGCEQRCAARGTEMYSGKPAASIVVAELIAQNELDRPKSARHLDENGAQAVNLAAERIAELVDELLEKKWSRTSGECMSGDETLQVNVMNEPIGATCSCGSGIPVGRLAVSEESVTVVALPLIFNQFIEAGKQPSEQTMQELLETLKIYNPIPAGDEAAYLVALQREFTAYCAEKEAAR